VLVLVISLLKLSYCRKKKKVEAKLEAASIAWDFDKMWWLSSNKVVMEGIVRTLSVSKDIYHICMQMAGH